MIENFDLLRRLCQEPGIPSREEAVARLVISEIGPLVDEVRSDALGNVIAVKRGEGGPRVMIAAHMDEIGFMVRHVEKEGFVRVHPVGGFDPRVLFAQRVDVHTREGALPGVLAPEAKPIHLLSADDKPAPLRTDNYFVDLGLPAETVAARVRVGDMVTMSRETVRMGDAVVSKALDDRLGVFIMIEALRAVGAHTAEIVAVATVQEEVGLRGATTAGYGVQPDIAIALDTTLAMDIPGTSESDRLTTLGGGTAIKIMDGSLICDPRVVNSLRDIAERENIKHQFEILPFGGTDAGAIQLGREGVVSGVLSTPSRYVHTVNEMCHGDDIQGAITLLARFLESAQDIAL